MRKESTNLEALSTRSGFNSAVRYINNTIDISVSLGRHNLGDLLYEKEDETVSGIRSALLLRMLLVDKYGYSVVSCNMESVAADIPALAKEFSGWKAVDLVAVYHHPDLGLLIANPKIAEELSSWGKLRKRELLVVYAGKGEDPADALCKKAAELALSLFQGGKPKTLPELRRGSFTVKKEKIAPAIKAAPKGKAVKAVKGKPAKAVPKKGHAKAAAAKESVRVAPPPIVASAPAISSGPMRMTPLYSVVVSNELFHNGNVEAWKRIISSYIAKYPALQVFIYYEGERILDINTLFKWGKVKHGSAIQFAVSGNDIKDVAKLQRYLVQGASSRFEAFLQGPVSTVMRLFG